MAHPAQPPATATRGFTLIELMIAMAIVALLATVALPSYQAQVRKGHRADVVDAASAVMQAQERHRPNNASYTTVFTA